MISERLSFIREMPLPPAPRKARGLQGRSSVETAREPRGHSIGIRASLGRVLGGPVTGSDTKSVAEKVDRTGAPLPALLTYPQVTSEGVETSISKSKNKYLESV